MQDFHDKLQKAWEVKKAAQDERKKASGGSTRSETASQALPSKKGDIQTVVDNAKLRAQQLSSRWPK